MQKQKKNLKLNLKIKRRFRRLFKFNRTFINPSIFTVKAPQFTFYLKATQNNVFCTLTGNKNKKIILNTSSGKEKINISKKTLAFGSKNVIVSFFNKIKNKVKNKNIVIKITAPMRIKVLFLRLLKGNFKNCVLLIHTEHKKCFNGCKPPKKKRKKQRGLRVFK